MSTQAAWATMWAVLCACNAAVLPLRPSLAAQNTPYSHSVNAVLLLDVPKAWTAGAGFCLTDHRVRGGGGIV